MEKKVISIEAQDGTTYEEKWVNMTLDEIKAEPVLCSGWASKGKVSNPHFGVSKSLQVAIAKQLPELVKYKFGDVSVLDPQLVVDDILNTYIETKGLDVKKIATNRTRVSEEAKQVMAAMKNPEMMAQIQAILAANPDIQE